MHQEIQVGDTRLSAEHIGGGPLVVLLHGGPGAYDYFAGSVLSDWLASAYSVWSYDQRGCRYSSSSVWRKALPAKGSLARGAKTQ